MRSYLSVITLSVRKLKSESLFLKRLGFKPGYHDREVAFFQANGLVLALYDAKCHARDYKIKASLARPGGVCLAQNQKTKKEVDRFMAKAKRAGAKITDAPKDTVWGGYAGCFKSPEGHLWEIAWNPHWKLDRNRNTRMK